MAITGPFEKTLSESGNRERKVWYRGGKALNKPLNHLNRHYKSTQTINGISKVQDCFTDLRCYDQSMSGIWPSPLTEAGALYTQAYDKLASKARSKANASIGVSLAECRESFRMIHKRVTQLTALARAVRKRDFGGTVRALGLAKNEQLKLGRRSYRVARQDRTRLFRTAWDKQSVKPAAFANNYLEIIFGWSPMIKDIQDALEVLDREFPVAPVRGSATGVYSQTDAQSFERNVRPEEVRWFRSQRTLRLQTTVVVKNPNVALAAEMGLINPFEVAWQVIPFSFLFDYFIGIGRYLGSYSDWVGLELRDSFWSRVNETTQTRYLNWHDQYGATNPYVLNESSKGLNFQRELRPQNFVIPRLGTRIGLPVKNLTDKAMSSVALLIQQLSNRK